MTLQSDPAPPGPSPDSWDFEPQSEPISDSHALVVEVDGFEGPLDLLLALARTQKVDLAKISILKLVEQYLAFIEQTKALRLEIAADYLVMAAWLAFLKSRFLLPRSPDPVDTASADDLAQKLTFRLMRLDAMRQAAAQLMTRKRLGIDVLPRGQPEGVRTIRQTTHTAEIYDLLRAYADQRRRTVKVVHVVKARRVWSIKEARSRLEHLVGAQAGQWLQLDLFFEQFLPIASADDTGPEHRTILASSFGASLELARDGRIELRQDEPFGPIFMRERAAGAEWRVIGS